MNGAESLVRTLVGGGVEVCFANRARRRCILSHGEGRETHSDRSARGLRYRPTASNKAAMGFPADRLTRCRDTPLASLPLVLSSGLSDLCHRSMQTVKASCASTAPIAGADGHSLTNGAL